MPEVLTLVLVAVLGILVGAVGIGAFRLSQRQQDEEDTVAVDEGPLSSDVLAVLTAIPGTVVVVDASDAVLRADATAYAKGLTRGNDLVHPELLDLVHRVRVSGLSLTENLELPRSSLHHAGTLDYRVRVTALPAGRVLLIADDQTQQRRNEATRRDFTANVSHELKTPIGAIGLLAETIAADPTDAETVAHFAPRLITESHRLSTLVQDIIELSRLQAPDALDEPSLVPIDEVVDTALARQETSAETAGIELVRSVELTGARVWGDEDMLVTAVRNLIDNAVRYSPRGSRVSVGVTCEDDLVSIAVVDSGIGISEEDQKRIFERFYRSDPARSRATGGTGLGLSIVKHVASDHGGTVTVWSRPGRGSTFTLVLPVASLASDAGRAGRSAPRWSEVGQMGEPDEDGPVRRDDDGEWDAAPASGPEVTNTNEAEVEGTR